VRHGVFQGIAAHDQCHLARVVGAVERRLTGRIAGPNQMNVEPVRRRDLAARRPIGDALADELIDTLDGQAAPRDAGGENQRAGANDVATVEQRLARRRIDAGDSVCFRPEAPRLLERTTGSSSPDRLGERDSSRSRADVPPAARRLALDDDRAQPPGGSVDGRGRPAGRRR
jgi:hypothetical protein